MDAGNFAWRSPTLPTGRQIQQQIEGTLILQSMALSGIDAMAVGEGDLALGVGWLQRTALAEGVPLLSANLHCEGVLGFERSRLIERSERRIGITAVIGPDAQLPEDCMAEDVATSLSSAFEDLGTVDVRIVLSSKAIEQVESSEMDDGIPTVVVDGGYGKTLGRSASLKGGTQRLAAGSRGKKLGLASLDWGDPSGVTGVQLISLDRSISDHPETLALVEQAEAKMEQESSRIARADALNMWKIENSPFIGNEACSGCHADQTQHWKSTTHAKAWNTLLAEGRTADLDCYSCHATGAHHPDGPTNPAEVGSLMHVGCESCHGPGRAHSQSPLTAPLVSSPSEDSCRECHDGVRDEGRFDPKTYFPKIRH